MRKQSKGSCTYCGKEYTKASMQKHIFSCKERESQLRQNSSDKNIGYFGLAISGKYTKSYWLITEFREDATLEDVDHFLRDIWLECCGHLSAFTMGGISYDSDPDSSDDWGLPSKGMNSKLKTLLEKGMVLDYEYDFGSTTSLTIQVCHYRIGARQKDKLTVLSRNHPLELICDHCESNRATAICAECIYEGTGHLCDDCQGDHECGEDMLMSVYNSPRSGVCAYEGSTRYPD